MTSRTLCFNVNNIGICHFYNWKRILRINDAIFINTNDDLSIGFESECWWNGSVFYQSVKGWQQIIMDSTGIDELNVLDISHIHSKRLSAKRLVWRISYLGTTLPDPLDFCLFFRSFVKINLKSYYGCHFIWIDRKKKLLKCLVYHFNPISDQRRVFWLIFNLLIC